MRAPFEAAAADQPAALLEVKAIEQSLVERPPGGGAEIQVPVDLLLVRLGFGRAASRSWRCSTRPDGRRAFGVCRACRGGPGRRRRRNWAGCAAGCRPGRRGRCGGTSRPARGFARCSSCRASRNRHPCRHWPPGMAAVACQFGPVAISTASMSLRASSSRRSRYMAQSWLPYFVIGLLLDGLAACGLHVANGDELHVRFFQETAQVVGAAVADADGAQDDAFAGGNAAVPAQHGARGTICGAASKALTWTAAFRNRRRLSGSAGSIRAGVRVGNGAGVAVVTVFIIVLSQVRTQAIVLRPFWPKR